MRLQQAIGKLAQLRHGESDAGQLQLKQEQWQAKQKEAAAKAWSFQKLFPIHAALLQHGLHSVMECASPGTQAVVLQTLERLTRKRPEGVPATAPKPAQPIKPFQGNSSHGKSADQTESDRIKPNQT